MGKRQLAVAYVEINKILFYVKDTKNNLQLDFPSDTVSDLEIINRNKFDQLLDSFFQTGNLKNIDFDIILVFSQATTFEKDFIDDTTKVKYEETQKFLEMVPFEEVLNNIYKINKKTKIVAVNKSFYDAFRAGFERNKARMVLVLPMSILAEVDAEFTSSVDLELICAKADSLKQYGLIEVSEGSLEREQKNSIGIKKKDIRLYILLGIFALLFIVLLILIYTTFLTSKVKTKKTVVLPKTQITPTATKENTLLASKSGEIASFSSQLKP